jgi:hypothetical protein
MNDWHQQAAFRTILTGRFHAMCFSLANDQPFVAIASNSHKIEGVFEELGDYAKPYLLSKKDFLALPFREITALLQKAACDTAFHASCHAYKNSAKERIRNMFKIIRETI